MYSKPYEQNKRIAFFSTRLSGTDGVSLESEKWVQVLHEMGHECYFFSGLSEWEPDRSWVVPEANFNHPDIKTISDIAFSSSTRPPGLTRKIEDMKNYLKKQIYAFVREFDIQVIIIENAVTIPMNLPLGIALTEFIAETGIPTIAHHHDFFWERTRFLVNCVWDYLNMAFPPHLPAIEHVVINSSGANQLALRTGISSTLIPNVMDFDTRPPEPGEYCKNLREDVGVAPDELLFLQPTRVVPRKGIEDAIELVSRIKRKARLVISHSSGDEGYEYERYLKAFADQMETPVNFVDGIIGPERGTTAEGRKIYAVWDIYYYADLVTYPSTFEGFGNAFLEAVYYKRPILVNNYSIYMHDIKPKGFRTIEFDGYITNAVIEKTNRILDNPDLQQEMVEVNYDLGKRYYSFNMLRRRLELLLYRFFGEQY